SESPIEGIVTPANPARINITFDSEGLRLGTYSAFLRIVSNDRDNPTIYVPIKLTIATGIYDSPTNTIPTALRISSLMPNPFNSLLTVKFNINKDGEYRIELFNLTGEKVNSVDLGILKPGEYHRTLNFENMPSGVYFVLLRGNKENFISKAILLK
ncbi:MAG: T9SS type A sorting domain-containing protein, partial [bacterium]